MKVLSIFEQVRRESLKQGQEETTPWSMNIVIRKDNLYTTK
jgi:hypothetical protein